MIRPVTDHCPSLFLLIGLAVSGLGVAGCTTEAGESAYFPLPQEGEAIRSRDLAFMVDTLVTDLEQPWGLEFLPDGRVLITERDGKVRLVKEGKLLPEPINEEVREGLRDVALHPGFESNGWVYLSWYRTMDASEMAGAVKRMEERNEVRRVLERIRNGEFGGTMDEARLEGRTPFYSILTRARLEGDRLVEEEILYFTGPFRESPGWFGSRIAFDPDGSLYFLVGQRDGDPTPQEPGNTSGTTLRLREDGSVPPDNPFVDHPEILSEVFTYGHRQHQGVALHPDTGELWTHEHGAKGGDEINILKPGLNFGWPLATYSLNYDDSIISPDTLLDGTELPIHHWTPSIAPSGMTFVTGGRYPEWEGDLISGSLKFRLLNRTILRNGRVAGDEPLAENVGRVRSVKTAPDGLIYFVTEDTGLLARLVPSDDGPPAGRDALLTIRRTEDFEVTGTGENPNWNLTEWVELTQLDNRYKSQGLTSRVKVLYSGAGIYFLFDNSDRLLTASLEGDFREIWNEDVVEVFFWPDEESGDYFEYELSPLNYELILWLPERGGGSWIPFNYYKSNRQTRHETSVRGGVKESGAEIKGWRAEFFIPWRLLRPFNHVPPEPESRWRANMYRIDYDDGATHFAWQPIERSYHEIRRYGTFLFE